MCFSSLVISLLLLAPTPELRLSVFEDSGRVTVAIEVDQSPGIGALEATLVYDPAVLRYVDLVGATEVSGPIRSVAVAGSDQLRFAFASAGGPPPDGVLGRLEFEFRDPAGFPTELRVSEVTAYDLTSLAPVTMVPGRVSLTAKSEAGPTGWGKLPPTARLWVMVLAAGALLALLFGRYGVR